MTVKRQGTGPAGTAGQAHAGLHSLSASDNKQLGELSAALRAMRGLLPGIAAFSCAINLLMLTPAIFMLQVYDRVLSSRNQATLFMLALLVLGLYALHAVLEWLRSKALIRASTALDLRLAPRVFDASFERSLRSRSGSAGPALGDLNHLRQFLTGKALLAFFDAPWTPIYLALIFVLHPVLGFFSLAAATTLLVMAWINERATARLFSEASKQTQQAGQDASGQLRQAEAIEAMGMLARLRQRWLKRRNDTLALQSCASDRAAVVGAGTRFVRLATQSGVLGLGALLVIDNQMSAGGMFAASLLLGRALSPVELAMGHWRGFVSARDAYLRLRDLLAAQPTAPERTALPRPQGFVTVDKLVVAPPGTRQPVLKSIQFGAAPGMLVAVIGASASGKSTLARALVGVWAPLSGAVRLDGASVHQWDKAQLGPWVGYLPQDVELFEGTVAQNIARFDDATDAAVVEAAQRAGVHEMILRLPQGYETPVGEAGVTLSGGQAQRIGLARAMYGDPALLVLDEPNANLDEAGDAALVSALKRMKSEKRTTFVVTHRRNLLHLADAVIVLAGGHIQAYGPRDAVLRSMGVPAVAAPVDEPALIHARTV